MTQNRFTTYQDNFSDWSDVKDQYQMEAPKPEKVLLAQYSYEDYSGDSTVIYYDKGKIYYNSGSHCSCYGLEGQWDPTEYEVDEYLKVLERQLESFKDDYEPYGCWYVKPIYRRVKALKKKLQEKG